MATGEARGAPGEERREREVKLELAGASDHERLLAALPPPFEVREQRNHYFDLPEGALRTAGVMLRLRIEGDSARLTVKEGARRDAAGLFDSAEREEVVDRPAALAVAEGRAPFTSLGGELIASLAARFGSLGALARWGSLANRRSRHRLPDGLVVEVDRAVYPDGSVLHEVELEIEGEAAGEPESSRRRLEIWLDAARAEWRPSTASKAERLALRSTGR